MRQFDFSAPADLYTSSRNGMRKGHLKYRRFERGADAVRFVVEDLAKEACYGLSIECDDGRFDASEVKDLYDSDAYPLTRKA